MDQKNQELNNKILNFKSAIQGMIASSKDAYIKTDAKYSRSRSKFYSREEIDSIVQSGNPVEQAELSEFYFVTNSIYKRIILHYATFLTYSWVLVPTIKDRKSSIADKKNSTVYYNASDFCTNFQIERKCALFAKEVLTKGAYYGLIHHNGKEVVIQDLPFEYCRTRYKNQQDIDIVEFNVSFFDTIRDEALRKEILKTYPKVVEKGYNLFKYKGGPKWIFLPDDMGIYFSYFEERPLFLNLIPLLDDLEDYKDIDKKRNKQALKRILTQKIGTDGLKLIFEPEEAEEMHEGVLQMLQNNEDIDVVTTYADINLLDLSSDDDEKTEIKDVQDLIYESAGLSKEFFFSTTETGLEYSTNNDLAMMMILGHQFAHFFTTLLNYRFENNKIKFKLIILPLSHYNSKEYTSLTKELAAFGYSFLIPVLPTGIDQTNLSNLKALENDLLKLDKMLKPLQSSYTQTNTPSDESNKDDSNSEQIEDSKQEDQQSDINNSNTEVNT